MSDLIRDTCKAIEPIQDDRLDAAIRARLDDLTKPRGSLGRLEDVAFEYARIRGELLPAPPRAAMYVFCADHGVTAEGVSAYPREVTAQMVLNFARGGAAINVLCRRFGIEARVVDIGVDADLPEHLPVIAAKVARGTRNFAVEPAMTEKEAAQAVEQGIALAQQAVDEGFTLLAAGEMGIGNTTAAAAVGAALLGCAADEIVGAGTGIEEAQRKPKVAVIERALAARQPGRLGCRWTFLTKVGGLEIAAMTGFYLGAAARRTPVVVDGFIASAAALVAVRLAPAARGRMLFAHRSAEKGHGLLLQALDAAPLFDLGMRLGEGSGAALAIGAIDAALRLYLEMATFSGAGVRNRD